MWQKRICSANAAVPHEDFHYGDIGILKKVHGLEDSQDYILHR